MLLLVKKLNKLAFGWNEDPLTESAVYELCSSLGVTVEETPLAVDGFYFRAAGREFIAVNSCLAPILRLKVLLHEVGHLLIHAPVSGTAAGFYHIGRRTRQEVEADVFAVCGLIPRSLIEKRTADELADDGFPRVMIAERMAILRDHGI